MTGGGSEPKDKPGMDKGKAILYAFLAAVFYEVNVPLSKILLREVGPTMMAALLYLGAGIGIGVLSLVNKKYVPKQDPSN